MTNPTANPPSTSACCGSVPEVQLLTGGETGVTLGGIIDQLGGMRGLPLAFSYAGATTKPGYHITEFKAARVTGLDCGANVESWSETVLQIWDIADSVTGERMTVDKLLGIARKAIATVGAELSSRVVFEVSDGSDSIRVFAFDRLENVDGVAVVHLGARVSACKPLERGILNVPGSCGPKTANPATLGAGLVSRPKSSQCCG